MTQEITVLDASSRSRPTWAEMGFLRVAAVVPEHRVGDVVFNSAKIVETLGEAANASVQLAVYPELALTGYSCGDLFYQSSLRAAVGPALEKIVAASARARVACVVGLPWIVEDRLYNCAAFLAGGRLLGLVPKIHLPCTNEFYEERWFTSGRFADVTEIRCLGQTVPFGADLLFAAEEMPLARVGIELCEDLWSVQPPSGRQALAGAKVLVNLSASNEVLGKTTYRRALVQQQSARCLAAYIYSAAGPGESSMDTVYSGHAMIAENGALLAEAETLQILQPGGDRGPGS